MVNVATTHRYFRSRTGLRAAAAGSLCTLLALAGCNSASSPPPSPSGMPSSLPSGAPSTPGSSSPSRPSSSPPSSQGGSSGPSQPSGGQSSPGGAQPGSQSPSGGSAGQQSGGGSPMPDGGGSMPDGGLPGTAGGGTLPSPAGSGGTQSGSGGGDDSWESGLPGRSGDGWETSNQLPGGGESRIPPMPSERGRPPGSGDGELDGALEEFDGEILSEREVIRQRSNETAGTGGTSLPEASAGAPGGTGGDVDMPTRGGPMGVPSNRNAPPAPSPVASAGVPDDIPDAKDDDIIARQLREAAIQETDPGLKEKLWDEYRRYKGI